MENLFRHILICFLFEPAQTLNRKVQKPADKMKKISAAKQPYSEPI
jgi:hypothetical protein